MMTKRQTGEKFRHRQRQRRSSPHHPHRVIEKQDDAEGGDHLIEVIAVVEVAENQKLQQQAEEERGGERQHQRKEEISHQSVEGYGEISAEHILHAVRQVDEVHHTEHQRQAGCNQEQKNAELQAVEDLDQKERGGHGLSSLAERSAAGEGA